MTQFTWIWNHLHQSTPQYFPKNLSFLQVGQKEMISIPVKKSTFEFIQDFILGNEKRQETHKE